MVGLLLRSAHALRAVRQFAWLGAGSVKVALSRPGRAPGWCPIPPTSTPKGHTPLGENALGDDVPLHFAPETMTPAVGQAD
ncbi:MAG TPA: hypothetical protein VMN99_05010 [Anaerolineales bacterium]|nr:hypothetical protein [Anaerolineales bacterium]